MKIFRYIFAILLAGLFVFLAYYLYDRQQYKYSFLSFSLNNESESVLIPNINRLMDKLESPADFEVFSNNIELNSGLTRLFSKENLDFNEVFGADCFVSFTATNFNIVFSNPDLDYSRVVNFINNNLGLAASYSEGILKVNDDAYTYKEFGTYTIISNGDPMPLTNQSDYLMSNADYIVFRDSISSERYIISDNRKFKVWNKIDKPVRGNPTIHSDLIARVPSSFQSIQFYGSTRFQEDKNSFFVDPIEDAYSWVGDGFVLMKKDSFEVLLSTTNDQRDLKLILQEQTLKMSGDTGVINYLNIKNAEIMPFKSAFNWHESIPALDQSLAYYTEFENYNLLSNNLGAMRWFLSEVQIGNLLGDNDYLYRQYLQSTPIKSHVIRIEQRKDAVFFETAIWIDKTKCTHAQSLISKLDGSKIEDGKSFDSPFNPNFIQPFKQESGTSLLLSNDRNVAVYSNQGEQKWKFNLPADLIQKPSIIDLQNDGKKEFAFFMKDQFIVLNSNGKPVAGLSIKLNQQIVGGLCANYDQKFDYRFFIITQNAVKLYDERGQVVTGWTFNSGGVSLTGQSAYTQIEGKDYISFLGTNEQLFVLNRRGENRFTNAITPKLNNESNFITGKNQSDLHKLGYSNQHIYMHFLKDATTDSLKLDKRVNGIGERWIMLDRPLLLIEEPTRILLFNTFGYVEEEILKPQGATAFIRLESSPEIRFVFFNNSNNSLYLLDGDGKIILSALSTNTAVYGINATHFYSFDGNRINEHKLN